MMRIRIIKKKDEHSPEYEAGQIVKTTGTWQGGVYIKEKSGITVSLDRDEYIELDTEPAAKDDTPGSAFEQRRIMVGDIVRHFKREWITDNNSDVRREYKFERVEK